MANAKYQKAQYIRDMLAEESAHGLNMQMVLARLTDEDLDLVEQVVQKCRHAREIHSEPQTVTFVVDMEDQFA